MLTTRLLVVHNSRTRGEHHEAELTRRQQVVHPLLQVLVGHVEARRDDTSLVEAAVQLDDNLARAVIVNDLKLANVA